ncbi:hypothetical protein SS1G_09476 [Sclerotinia sclerotiorum 1980 UF-70]|uniref:AB hydrolase-1 domain-containing protein n=1 Tax=Sclerotinia sclerotiorum (strain ATCC 18683 / 1980 / Ss-1) TaxID=665079 RepID=A7EVW7_SCLS1|nr:hypothetical protein SS1G_09476 [Sclerotinia sclerotiorum 1980 UF-70]EDN93609.1 hypothetical protein SS1G_09476 [Sclerotinia sclerotiorum 1980 UF-70]
MINNSWAEYVFIRICIFALQSIPLVSLAYCFSLGFTTLFPDYHLYRVRRGLEVVFLTESFFFLFCFLPYRIWLQREAVHPPAPSREERAALFQKCSDNITDPEAYLQKWFLGADIREIRRENVKEFFLWAFFNRDGPPGDDEEELEEYIGILERQMGREIPDGRGNARCLRLTLDEVVMSHRSLIWYCHISYWHRPHTSKTKLPVVFIHGIGIGLYPYTKFLDELNSSTGTPDDHIGILALEIMNISFRLTHSALSREETALEIFQIIGQHFGPNQKFVLVSHSYGTVVTTHLLQSPVLSPHIGPIVLIDPVSICLHLPSVAFNFTRRIPRDANEYQLYYFASMDPGVSHTLSRKFFWNENVLWKEDFEGRKVTASLAGRDLIVDTEAVGRYLCCGSLSGKSTPSLRAGNGNVNGIVKGTSNLNTAPLIEIDESEVSGEERIAGVNVIGSEDNQGVHDEVDMVDDEEWKYRDWKGVGTEVLWFGTLDHAQVFDKMGTRKRIIDVVRRYCEDG